MCSCGSTAGLFTLTGVAVEKLTHQKMVEKTLLKDALQTTFSVFLDIFYPPNFRCFEKNGLFQQPQAVTLTTRKHFSSLP
jgi:hypothetical protein